MKRIVIAIVLSFSLLVVPSIAHADDVAAAKEAFTRGLELAHDQKWGEALDAFETAGRAKPHALTTYNAAVAERALSRYTRARVRFAAALAEDVAAGGTQLSQSYKDDAKTFLAELDALLVHVNVTLDPVDASLAIDGRPLSWTTDDHTIAFAGIAAPGAGERVDKKAFEVVLDPGAHVFTVTKDGFETVATKEDLKPGSKKTLALSLTAMPGKLKIDASQGGSAVRIDDIDVGLAPLLVDRPAGDYRIDVRKSGYVPYVTRVTLRPGQRTDILARMADDPPLTKRWWFWTSIGGALLAGGVVAALIVANAADYDGGNQGWVAQPR
jgi:hypothetical protein